MAEVTTDDWRVLPGPRPPLHLSREERDHIAGHARDSIQAEAETLAGQIGAETFPAAASSTARRIAALSNLLGDTGWERKNEAFHGPHEGQAWLLGELFPVAQLRPWLEEWQRQDADALFALERASKPWKNADARTIAYAQTKLGTGAILLARLEKWMASRGN